MELNILFDSENLEFCVDKLGILVNNFGIKLGKRGSLVVDCNKVHLINPSPIKAKDSTGAGDMYAAGFLTSLAKGKGYHEAGIVAVHLAEEVIQIDGAQFGNKDFLVIAKKVFANF